MLLALGCALVSSPGAEPTYYRNLMGFIAANPGAWEVQSPLFVDTNNTAFKLTNMVFKVVDTNLTEAKLKSLGLKLTDTNHTRLTLTNVMFDLSKIRATGTVAGVRPGMGMDEVVRLWGKPMELWAKGFGGPRLRYREVSVFFDPARDSVRSIYTQDLPSLLRKLDNTPRIEDCLNALGAPSYQENTTSGKEGFLVYETAATRLKVGCTKGRLASIQLEVAE